MATFTVTTAADAVNVDDGALSLREAVARANATAGADTIRFADALDGRTLRLSQGQLTLTADTAVEGVGSGVSVDAVSRSRVLAVTGVDTDVTLRNLVITGGQERDSDGGGVLVGVGAGLSLDRCTLSGNAAGYRGADGEYSDGGGVFARSGSRVTVSGSIVRGNDSDGFGGGIATAAGVELRVEDSRFLDNRAGDGGAISLKDGSSLTLSRSLLSGNDASAYRRGDGGGIEARSSSVLVSSSTISGNEAYYAGGGIGAGSSTIVVTDSTIAGNRALGRLGPGQGGAIEGYGGRLSLASSTVTGNFEDNLYLTDAGRPTSAAIDFNGEVSIANSVVAGNYGSGFFQGRRAADIVGTIAASNGHNVFGSDVDGAAAGDREGVPAATIFAAVDPATSGGRLALNGVPTLTVALLDASGNPALSGGEPVVALDTDQRGVARPSPDGGNPDVGAFELDQATTSRVASAGNDALTGTAGADALSGRSGADFLAGRGGADRLNGNDGGDTLQGGPGVDALDGGTGFDTASYRAAGGPVTVSLAVGTSSGAAGVDRLLRLENLEGGRFGDRLTGDARGNGIDGGGGTDTLRGLAGRDGLLGGGGVDRLNGGGGADLLAGGGGRDLFDYDALADSAPGAAGRDLVLDFAHLADRFDLSTLDARAGTAGNQAFAFLAAEGAAFTVAGQVRWFQEGGETFVEANVDAARGADLQIELAGLRTITGGDFVL